MFLITREKTWRVWYEAKDKRRCFKDELAVCMNSVILGVLENKKGEIMYLWD